VKHTILNGDVIDCLRSLPDACVQCVVTSPPYWGLRDYGVEGQIGLEPTPEAYVEKMVEVFREVKRVLRDDGTLWLNLGDSYAGSGKAGNNPEYQKRHTQFGKIEIKERMGKPTPSKKIGLKPKDLVGIPWRVAFALQEDGWYLRSDIIWSKPNPMPESVTDRPTKSHEYVFLLAKQARYFYDADAVREAHVSVDQSPRKSGVGNGLNRTDRGVGREFFGNPAGRNRRTVWEIATQPMPEAHFATFPEALVEPCIKAGTSERGACPECGAPWRRVVERLPVTGRNENKTPASAHAAVKCSRAGESHVKTVGWEPSCGCETQDGEPVPCIVLDPFGGSGTVAKVARDLGRSSISCELNPEYVEIAKKRLRIGEQLDSGVCEYEVRSLLRGE
jgi:DNA modification methylase